MSDTTAGGSEVRFLDCRGLLCPVPIIRVSKAVKELPVGGRLEMVATDPGSEPDMKAWEKQTGHRLISATKDGTEFRFLIERAR